jgi:hypothetical protein
MTMTKTEPATVLFQGEPLTMERARDLARRGFQPIEIDLHEQDPEKPGYLRFVRRRSPIEVLADLNAVLGDDHPGGEEGLHVYMMNFSQCVRCECDHRGRASAFRYTEYTPPTCSLHPSCTGYLPVAKAPWPSGQVTVSSARGGSEGDYTHVEVQGKLILLAKTFQGRDASWQFARDVADLLGV